MSKLKGRQYVVLVVEDRLHHRVLHAEVHDRSEKPGKFASVVRALRRHWLELRFSHPMQSIQSYSTTHPEQILRCINGPAHYGLVVFRQTDNSPVYHELLDLTKLSPQRRRRKTWWHLRKLQLRYRPPVYRVERVFCSSKESFYLRYPDVNQHGKN